MTTDTLSNDEVVRFHTQGFLGPFTLCTPAEMNAFREQIDREVLPEPGPDPARNEHARHLDKEVVATIIAHPAIVGRLKKLLGPDIVLWSSNFWNKEPGGLEIPWHQDINYWPIEPPLNISAWIAIDQVTKENACVQLVPRSHRKPIKHVPVRGDFLLAEEADPAEIDLSEVVNMELLPGQFFLFNERLLHHSDRNRSDRRRLGLAARYTIPMVKLLEQDSPPLFPGHRCVLISGEDRFQLNRSTSLTPARTGEET